MGGQSQESNSRSVFEGPVYGPVHTGPGDMHIGELHYGRHDYDVEPGKQHVGDIYRTTIDSLQKPIRIGAGNQVTPTIVRGSLAGYRIHSEDYILVEGSVCGLQRVVVGKHNYIQGTVVGSDVKADEGLVVIGDVLARRLTLKARTNVRGHIVCEKILDSNGNLAQVLPPIRLGGVLVCDQALELTAQSRIRGIISTGDVNVASLCPVDVIVAKGAVYISKKCYVPYVQCARLTVGGGAKVAFACVKEWADLGDNAEIGFLYCGKEIKSIGEGVQLWNSTLISRHRCPTVKDHFRLIKSACSRANALGITSQGRVVDRVEFSQGVLYTNLIDRNLLTAIGELTQDKLYLPDLAS